jgi:hypothetical protein
MADISKNSNVFGLDAVINHENLAGNIDELRNVDMSVATRSIVSNMDDIFSEGTVDRQTFTSGYSYGSGSEDEEGGDDDESLSEDSLEMGLGRKKIIINPNKKDFQNVIDITPAPKQSSDLNETHLEMLESINKYVGALEKRKVPVPNYDKKKIKRDIKYAGETVRVLRNASDDNSFALSISSFIDLMLKMLCSFFDGRHEILGFKIDLTGYDTAVRADFSTMYSDTVEFATVFRRKFGRKGMVGFNIFKTFGVNLGLTLYKNNSGLNNANILNSDDFGDNDSYVEMDDEDEEEDEE